MTTNTTVDMSVNKGKNFIRLYHCRDCLMVEVQENPPGGRTQLFPLTPPGGGRSRPRARRRARGVAGELG